jgi:hypothetical protein
MEDSQNSEECCEFDIDDCEVLEGYTKKIVFGCGTVYLTVDMIHLKPVRVFIRVGKAGHCQRVLHEAVGNLVTLLLERGRPYDRIIHTLSGMRCDKGAIGKLSCMDTLAKELKQYTQPAEEPDGSF